MPFPAGNYTLLVSYVGYKKDKVLNVKASDNNSTSVDVKLQASSENTGVHDRRSGFCHHGIAAVANTTDAQLRSMKSIQPNQCVRYLE